MSPLRLFAAVLVAVLNRLPRPLQLTIPLSPLSLSPLMLDSTLILTFIFTDAAKTTFYGRRLRCELKCLAELVGETK
jgi:hypothetical protein